MSDIDISKIRQLDGALLLVFQSLIRHHRTTVAAERLNVGQSTISHALARLRLLFDDPLFVRRPHGLQPTIRAMELAPQIDALIDAVGAALGGKVGFDAALATRSFRLASSDFLATLLAPGLLGEFQRQAPNSRFALGLALGQAALRQVRHNEVDLALGQFLRTPDGLDAVPLFTDDYCLVLRAGHPLIVAGRIDREAFATLDHIAVSVAGDYRTPTERDFADRGLSRRIIAAAPRFPTAFAMVASSLATCIAPRRLAMAQAGAFGLEVCDLPVSLPSIRIVAVRRRIPDAAVDWLLGALLAAVQTPREPASSAVHWPVSERS